MQLRLCHRVLLHVLCQRRFSTNTANRLANRLNRQPTRAPAADDGTKGESDAPARSFSLPLNPPSAAARSEAASALHEKLLPLTVGIWRADKLAAALQQYKDNAAAEVKAAVRDVVQQLVPALLAAAAGDDGGGGAGPAAGAAGGGGAWSGGGPAEVQLADQLQQLQHGAFMQLLSAVSAVLHASCDHVILAGKVLEDIMTNAQAHTRFVVIWEGGARSGVILLPASVLFSTQPPAPSIPQTPAAPEQPGRVAAPRLRRGAAGRRGRRPGPLGQAAGRPQQRAHAAAAV
jgi:hypothetical protein